MEVASAQACPRSSQLLQVSARSVGAGRGGGEGCADPMTCDFGQLNPLGIARLGVGSGLFVGIWVSVLLGQVRSGLDIQPCGGPAAWHCCR